MRSRRLQRESRKQIIARPRRILRRAGFTALRTSSNISFIFMFPHRRPFRYRAYRLQADFSKAFVAAKHQSPSTGGWTKSMRILFSQFWSQRRAIGLIRLIQELRTIFSDSVSSTRVAGPRVNDRAIEGHGQGGVVRCTCTSRTSDYRGRRRITISQFCTGEHLIENFHPRKCHRIAPSSQRKLLRRGAEGDASQICRTVGYWEGQMNRGEEEYEWEPN